MVAILDLNRHFSFVEGLTRHQIENVVVWVCIKIAHKDCWNLGSERRNQMLQRVHSLSILDEVFFAVPVQVGPDKNHLHTRV